MRIIALTCRTLTLRGAIQIWKDTSISSQVSGSVRLHAVAGDTGINGKTSASQLVFAQFVVGVLSSTAVCGADAMSMLDSDRNKSNDIENIARRQDSGISQIIAFQNGFSPG